MGWEDPLEKGYAYPLQDSWASLVAQLVKNPPAMWETWVLDPWIGKIPWRRERLPTAVFWPGESHGLYSPRGRKELDTTERLVLHFSVYLCQSYSLHSSCPFLSPVCPQVSSLHLHLNSRPAKSLIHTVSQKDTKHPSVCSQDMGATYVSIRTQMDKEAVVDIYSGMLHSHNRE